MRVFERLLCCKIAVTTVIQCNCRFSVQKLPINKHNIVYGLYLMQDLSCWENGMGKWATVLGSSSRDHGAITIKTGQKLTFLVETHIYLISTNKRCHLVMFDRTIGWLLTIQSSYWLVQIMMASLTNCHEHISDGSYLKTWHLQELSGAQGNIYCRVFTNTT